MSKSRVVNSAVNTIFNFSVKLFDFGIKFVLLVLSGLADTKELIPSIIITVLFMGVIYGAYFVATYIGSKNIIKEEQI